MSFEDNVEYSESGNPIIRHKEKQRDFEPAIGDEKLIETIGDHVEKHIGKIDTVWHEIVSDLIHVDIYYVKPTRKFNFHALVTAGMSSKPMKTPEDVKGEEYAELLVLLPPEWKISEQDFKNEEFYWPIRQLKILARLPHEYDTWLSYGHSIPNGNPPAPFASNTKFNTILLIPSISLGKEFFTLKVNESKTIYFYALVPLYQEEVDFKLKKGVDALMDIFDKEGISDVINLNRKNTCLKRFGLF